MYTDLMSISWIVTECIVIFNKEKYFDFNQEQTKTPKNFTKIRFEIEFQIFKELLVLQDIKSFFMSSILDECAEFEKKA